MELWARARHLLEEFGKGRYRYGAGALEGVGAAARELGERALVVGNRAHLEGSLPRWKGSSQRTVWKSLVVSQFLGRGLYPRFRCGIRDAVLTHAPDFVIAVGGEAPSML